MNLYKKNYKKAELAKKSIFIEKQKLRENNGYQDQIWAAYGGFNIIEFKKDKSFRVTKIKINEQNKKNIQSKLIMFFVGKHRFSNKIEKDKQSNLVQNLNFMIKLKNKLIYVKIY